MATGSLGSRTHPARAIFECLAYSGGKRGLAPGQVGPGLSLANVGGRVPVPVFRGPAGRKPLKQRRLTMSSSRVGSRTSRVSLGDYFLALMLFAWPIMAVPF